MKKLMEKIERISQEDLDKLCSGESFTITLDAERLEINSSLSNEWLVRDDKMEVGKSYKIKVKKYMIEPATITFDFHDKWNDGKPMPLLVMTGEVLKETRGMYQMKLKAVVEPTSTCMNCGRTLTNPVSRLCGIGPECGRHFHINPFDSEEELYEHLDELKQLFGQIEWTGFVIKSAIKEWEEV